MSEREDRLRGINRAHRVWTLEHEARVAGRPLPDREDAAEWDVELRATPEEEAALLRGLVPQDAG